MLYFQDLDLLANELNRMGRLPNNPPSNHSSGSISPPPPAPVRNTSLLISSNGIDKHHLGDLTPIDDTMLASEPASASTNSYQSDGTLRGPNKPLPPTPVDITPDFDEPNDGTLMIHRKHSRSNGNQTSSIRRNNSGSIVDLSSATNGAHNRLSIVGKAASVPDVSFRSLKKKAAFVLHTHRGECFSHLKISATSLHRKTSSEIAYFCGN
jgi:hypothetical protein